MNRRRSGTPGCTNIFMRVESGTKLQWDITKFLGEGKIETVKTRGQVGRLEFILEKANTASSGIYYSCPDTRHHFSILSPLSVLRNANGASAIRRPSRRVVPPREVFSKYPQAFQRCKASRITKFPSRSSLPLFARNSAFIFRESDHGAAEEGEGRRSERYSSGFYGRFGAKAIFHASETRKLR